MRIASTSLACAALAMGASIAAISSCEARSSGANAFLSRCGERQLEPARIVLGRRLAQVTLGDEPAQDAAQVPGVEPEAAREIGGDGRFRRMGELVEHADFRERPGAVVESLPQHADALRVEAVEAPYGVDARHGNRVHVPMSTN